MKILITGAGGFVGRHLLERLLEDDIEIIAFVREESSLSHLSNSKLITVRCDISDYANLDAADKRFADIDCIYHFAWEATSGNGRADVSLQLKNVKGTCDLIEFAKKIGCKRFINAASVMEYEAMAYLTQDNCKPGLGYIYSTAKLSADFMAKVLAGNYGISYSGIIISNIYGTGERSERFICKILNKMLKNEDIDLTHGEQLYDFIYISDAVEAIQIVGEQGRSGSDYYIGNSAQQPLKQYVLKMQEISESKSDLKFGSIAFHGPTNVYSDIDTQKLEREFGFVPKVHFEQGILLLIAEMKERSE